MIHDALQLLVNQLNASLQGTGGTSAVCLGNIAIDSDKEDMRQVVLSLVNVEEEAALKNGPNTRIKNGRVVYENRPVNLHLYLLFSANHKTYATALKRLGSVIEFFQGRNVFTVRDSSDLENVTRTAEELAGFRLTLELYSLSFEQINHLWGSLGGKQVPFVLYRARLVSLSAREFQVSGPPIEEISVDLQDTFTR